eukprot:gene21695-27745_t
MSTGDGERESSSAKRIPRNAIMGVHHPKYMLIFTSLGVHVVISTANISSQRSTDITWAQFFPRRGATGSSSDSANEVGSDFGAVLQDFIQKQSEQIVVRADDEDTSLETAPDLVRFMHLHAGIAEGETLSSTYDFSQAQVDLISVVPGRDALPPLSPEGVKWLYQHCGRDPDLVSAVPCKACLARSRKLRTVNFKFNTSPHSGHLVSVCGEVATAKTVTNSLLYGMLRAKDLLIRNEHLLTRSLTAQDSLVVQPTSIGVRIDNYYIDSLLCHYMPESLWEEQYDALRQDSWRLVWPSADFIARLSRRSSGSDEDDEEEVSGGSDEGCGLFLHPRSFAAMELDIHAQFHTYEASAAAAVSESTARFPPHNKTYARVMARESVRRDDALCATSSESVEFDGDRGEVSTSFLSSQTRLNSSSPHGCPFDFPFTQLTPPPPPPPTSLTQLEQDQTSCCGLSSSPSSDGTSSTEFDGGDGCQQDKVPSEAGGQESGDEKCTCADLAWCVLTSACLSRGAQGDEVPHGVCGDCGNIKSGYVEFRNFELGVMFHSRPGLRYRALSGKCPLHGQQDPLASQGASRVSDDVVLLPLPFEVQGGDPYCSESGHFQHRPYFHENHEANKYTVNQKLPQTVVSAKKVVTTAKSALKRSMTLDDGALRYTELWAANKRAMFACGEGENALVPRSLELAATAAGGGFLLRDPPATRAKTVGCSLTSVHQKWSQQSDEWGGDGPSLAGGVDTKNRSMNITDFLC